MNPPKPEPGKINCSYCFRMNTLGCEECRRCSAGCGCCCKKCSNCTPYIRTKGILVLDVDHIVKHHPKYFCKNCGKCKKENVEGINRYRCLCHKAPKFISPEHLDKKYDTRINPLRRHIGLEIEVSYLPKARLGIDNKIVKYEWVRDGSITAGGQELVVYPLAGDSYYQGITKLAGELAGGFVTDDSCGFHAHVDANDYGAMEIRRLILLYQKYEHLFYSLVHRSRSFAKQVHGEEKWYCKPWPMKSAWYEKLKGLKDVSEIRKYLIYSLYGTSVNDGGVQFNNGYYNFPSIRSHKYEKCRYWGLNLHTWFERRTVEFRHHEGTVALDKLLYWPLFCAWFVEAASRLSDKEAEGLKTVHDLLSYEKYSETTTIKPLFRIPLEVRNWVWETLNKRKVKVV